MEFSFSEIVLILAIALIVMGPKDLYKTALHLGRWSAKIRTQINNFKVMLNEELLMEERKKLEEAQAATKQISSDIQAKLNEKIDIKSDG